MYERKINSNICIEMFNQTIISYVVTIFVEACAIIDNARNPQHSIKKDKDVKDSNGINTNEIHIDIKTE